MNIDETPKEPCVVCGKLTKDRIVKRETICRKCLIKETPRIKNGDLRCCGNCKHGCNDGNYFVCMFGEHDTMVDCNECCESWTWDGLTQEQRKI